MGYRSSEASAVYVVVLAFHYGADFVTARCLTPMCTRPVVTYPEIIGTAEDCYKNATVITIGCAAGFRENGDNYSVKCNGETDDWIPDGLCNIELFSFIVGTAAFLLVVLVAALLIIYFRKNRRVLEVAKLTVAPIPHEQAVLTNVSQRRVTPELNNEDDSRPQWAGRKGVPAGPGWTNEENHDRTRHCSQTRVANTAYIPEPIETFNDIHGPAPVEVHPRLSSSIQRIINTALNDVEIDRLASLTSVDCYGRPGLPVGIQSNDATNVECVSPVWPSYLGDGIETEPSRDAAASDVSMISPSSTPHINIHGHGNTIYMPT